MNHLPTALGRLREVESELAESFSDLAERHSDDYEFACGCKLFTGWAKGHVARLEELLKEFEGRPANPAPRIRGTLFQNDGPPGLALLCNLEDLLTVTQRTRAGWISLEQAAKGLNNASLNKAVQHCSAQVVRTIAWLETQLKNRAPQALLVG